MKIRIFFIGIKLEGLRFSTVIAASRLFQRAGWSLRFRLVFMRRLDFTRCLIKANEHESVCNNFRDTTAEGIIMRGVNDKSLLTNLV